MENENKENTSQLQKEQKIEIGTIEKGLSKIQEEKLTPEKNLEGQLRLTTNYLDLSDYIDYWSE